MLAAVTRFRPCIDLHDGKVKQIVGSSLRDDGAGPKTNFVTDDDASTFARRYRDDALPGGHVIRLGAGNDAAARDALAAWPGGMQIGGGIDLDNAEAWLDAGASHVIVTSWLFDGGAIDMQRVRALSERVGVERLVIDLSCRRVGAGWRVATNRWQTITDVDVDARAFEDLAAYCDEFLIHAADVEGKCEGIDAALVSLLGEVCPRPCTYAGGARDIADLARIDSLSQGRVDLTYGSALDIFGGERVRYADCVAWNQRNSEA
jgi:phosphoribosylformimino-5-aminoimidazole carboxamide ribotide isomerase